MIGATLVPFGLLPLTRNRFSSASLQLPMPVSLSGVMLEPVTLKAGSSKTWLPPASARERSSPCGPRGVWQLWQTITLFNPVVYLVSGFRWSFFESSDVHIGVSLAMALFFLALCIGIVGWIFKTGYRLKN